MASGVLTLPPLGDLGIVESFTSQEPVAQPSPPPEAGAAAVSSEAVEASQLLGVAAGVDGEGVVAAAREPVGEEELEEKGGVVGTTTDEVEAYEKRIEAALAGTMSVEAKSKAQESLRSFLLRHPSQQCLVKSPSERHVVENEEAVKDVVAVLADAEFPGAPEVKEAVGALGVPALARPLLLLFQKVHTALPLLTVTVAPSATQQQLHQHHFNNPFMADYQSPAGADSPAQQQQQQQPLSARPPAGPSATPRPDGGAASPAAAAEVVVAVAAVRVVRRGPPTPPDINRGR